MNGSSRLSTKIFLGNIATSLILLYVLITNLFFGPSGGSAYPFSDLLMRGGPAVLLSVFGFLEWRGSGSGKWIIIFTPLVWPLVFIVNLFEVVNFTLEYVNENIAVGEISQENFSSEFWQQIWSYYNTNIAVWVGTILFSVGITLAIIKFRLLYTLLEKAFRIAVSISPIVFLVVALSLYIGMVVY